MSASITTWLGRLKAGEPDAARALWERYYAPLVAVAHRKLAGLPQRAADEEDVALSAFHSFCRAVAAGRFHTLDDRDDVWQLLVMHTVRKAIGQRRYQASQKRGGGGGGDGSAAVDESAVLEELVGAEPDPQFAASVAEAFDRLMERLDREDPLLRKIATKRLEGYSNREIARQLDWSLRTIERKLTVIRALWSEIGQAD